MIEGMHHWLRCSPVAGDWLRCWSAVAVRCKIHDVARLVEFRCVALILHCWQLSRSKVKIAKSILLQKRLNKLPARHRAALKVELLPALFWHWDGACHGCSTLAAPFLPSWTGALATKVGWFHFCWLFGNLLICWSVLVCIKLSIKQIIKPTLIYYWKKGVTNETFIKFVRLTFLQGAKIGYFKIWRK